MTLEFGQTVEWMGLEIGIPTDWEIVRHSLSLKNGKLTFIDRRRQRLSVTWSACEREPDLERMVDNQRTREREIDPHATVTLLSGLGAWHGVRSIGKTGDVVTRAVRYHGRTKRLIESVILTGRDEPGAATLVAGVLERLKILAAADEATHWRAFSVDVSTPPNFRLVSAVVKPADVVFRFGNVQNEPKKPEPVVTLRRMAMADSWYTGDAEAVIRRDAPKIEFKSFRELERAGHRAILAEGDEPAPPLQRWLGRARGRRVLVWRCERQNALYELMTSSVAKRAILPEQFEVHCCAPNSDG